MNDFEDTSGMFRANSDRGLGDWRRRKERKRERKGGRKRGREIRRKDGWKGGRKRERERKDGWMEIFSVGMEGSPDVFRIFAMIWHMMD